MVAGALQTKRACVYSRLLRVNEYWNPKLSTLLYNEKPLQYASLN